MIRRLAYAFCLMLALAALAAPAASAQPWVPGDDSAGYVVTPRHVTSHTPKIKKRGNKPCTHVIARCAVPE